MGEIVNLKRARKAKSRAEKESRAAENRARFGRTGAQKRLDAATQSRESARLDGHKRDLPAKDEDDA